MQAQTVKGLFTRVTDDPRPAESFEGLILCDPTGNSRDSFGVRRLVLRGSYAEIKNPSRAYVVRYGQLDARFAIIFERGESSNRVFVGGQIFIFAVNGRKRLSGWSHTFSREEVDGMRRLLHLTAYVRPSFIEQIVP